MVHHNQGNFPAFNFSYKSTKKWPPFLRSQVISNVLFKPWALNELKSISQSYLVSYLLIEPKHRGFRLVAGKHIQLLCSLYGHGGWRGGWGVTCDVLPPRGLLMALSQDGTRLRAELSVLQKNRKVQWPN